eukprot:3461680-Prymnesium_polylepis.1
MLRVVNARQTEIDRLAARLEQLQKQQLMLSPQRGRRSTATPPSAIASQPATPPLPLHPPPPAPAREPPLVTPKKTPLHGASTPEAVRVTAVPAAAHHEERNGHAAEAGGG